ncbi:hypothetical protein P7H20_26125 [Paenibacillus larvae]|nr:hypothetical protein [Paenibacillus larvae]MDT2277632.1 hypothetical protein [Paenibacillus larvae]
MPTLSEIKRPKGVQIVFEGEENPRTLLFDMNAMCVLEERFGDALAAFNKMIGSQKVKMKTSPTSLLLHYVHYFLLGLLMKMKR